MISLLSLLRSACRIRIGTRKRLGFHTISMTVGRGLPNLVMRHVCLERARSPEFQAITSHSELHCFGRALDRMARGNLGIDVTVCRRKTERTNLELLSTDAERQILSERARTASSSLMEDWQFVYRDKALRLLLLCRRSQGSDGGVVRKRSKLDDPIHEMLEHSNESSLARVQQKR